MKRFIPNSGANPIMFRNNTNHSRLGGLNSNRPLVPKMTLVQGDDFDFNPLVSVMMGFGISLNDHERRAVSNYLMGLKSHSIHVEGKAPPPVILSGIYSVIPASATMEDIQYFLAGLNLVQSLNVDPFATEQELIDCLARAFNLVGVEVSSLSQGGGSSKGDAVNPSGTDYHVLYNLPTSKGGPILSAALKAGSILLNKTKLGEKIKDKAATKVKDIIGKVADKFKDDSRIGNVLNKVVDKIQSKGSKTDVEKLPIYKAEDKGYTYDPRTESPVDNSNIEDSEGLVTGSVASQVFSVLLKTLKESGLMTNDSSDEDAITLSALLDVLQTNKIPLFPVLGYLMGAGVMERKNLISVLKDQLSKGILSKANKLFGDDWKIHYQFKNNPFPRLVELGFQWSKGLQLKFVYGDDSLGLDPLLISDAIDTQLNSTKVLGDVFGMSDLLQMVLTGAADYESLRSKVLKANIDFSVDTIADIAATIFSHLLILTESIWLPKGSKKVDLFVLYESLKNLNLAEFLSKFLKLPLIQEILSSKLSNIFNAIIRAEVFIRFSIFIGAYLTAAPNKLIAHLTNVTDAIASFSLPPLAILLESFLNVVPLYDPSPFDAFETDPYLLSLKIKTPISPAIKKSYNDFYNYWGIKNNMDLIKLPKWLGAIIISIKEKLIFSDYLYVNTPEFLDFIIQFSKTIGKDKNPSSSQLDKLVDQIIKSIKGRMRVTDALLDEMSDNNDSKNDVNSDTDEITDDSSDVIDNSDNNDDDLLIDPNDNVIEPIDPYPLQAKEFPFPKRSLVNQGWDMLKTTHSQVETNVVIGDVAVSSDYLSMYGDSTDLGAALMSLLDDSSVDDSSEEVPVSNEDDAPIVDDQSRINEFTVLNRLKGKQDNHNWRI